VSEQGGDGEPVGDAAHHRCLGGSADVAQPGVSGLVHPGGDEDDPHEDQQASSPQLHAVQVSLTFLCVRNVLHGRRIGGQADRRRVGESEGRRVGGSEGRRGGGK
jgi:hypothetical protein